MIVLSLSLKVIFSLHYSSQIPEISNIQTLIKPVQDQITDALIKAKRKPTADNLGALGMVYHSSANYQQAADCYYLAGKRTNSKWIWYYYLGYLHIEMGDSDAIIENFTRVIESNPKMGLAWYYLGEEYKNLRNNELAERAFNKIISFPGKSETGRNPTRYDHFPLESYARFQLSRIYFDSGRLDLAEESLKDIIHDYRTFGPAYRLLGTICSMKGDTALSQQYVDRAQDQLTFSPPVDSLIDKLALLSRSEFYLLKKIDEAERGMYPEWTLRLVSNALQHLPDNKYLISKAIKIYLWLDLDKEAAAKVDQHISYFQESFTEMSNTGNAFFQKRLYTQSVKYLNRALELKPANVEIRERLALCHWFVGEKLIAHEMLTGLAEDYPDNPDVIAAIANILYFNFGETENAAIYLAKLKQLSPSDPIGQKIEAGIAEKNGKIQEAITLYKASFRGNPQDITTIRYLGNALIDQEMWEQTINHYREALVYHPNDPYFLERLGTMLIGCPDSSLRNIEEGRVYSERAFTHISTRPNTLVYAGRGLAYAYAKLGDSENAIATIKETINLARRANFSSSYLAELEKLLSTFQNLDN